MSVLLKRLLLSISDTSLWWSFDKGGIGLLVLDVPGEDIPCQSLYFCHFGFFFSEKKIVLVRGKESRGKGSKRDEKGQKKISIFFHRTCGSAVT